MQDRTELRLQTERAIASLPAEVHVQVPRPLDMQRSAGVIGIRAVGEIGFELIGTDDLQQVDVIELAANQTRRQAAAVPSLPSVEQAFRYRSPTFALTMRVMRLLPQIESVVDTRVRVHERGVRLDSRAAYDVRDAGIFELSLAIPDGYRVEDVMGDAIRAWAEDGQDDAHRLTVTFGEKIRGAYRLGIALHRAYEELPGRLAVPHVTPLGVAESKGTVSIATAYGLTLGDYDAEGLSEMPVGHLGAAASGASLAFRHADDDWRLDIELQRSAPWVQAEGAHVVRLADGRISVDATFRYTIENAPVDRLVLAMPAGAENIRITGENIRQRNRRDQHWTVILQKQTHGTYELAVSFEVPLPVGSAEASVPLVTAEGTERERGVVLVCSAPTLYVKEAGRSEQFLLPLDTRDLPADVRDAGGNDARLAYRYLRPGQDLRVTLSRYQAAEVLQANIEKARLVAVLSRDGQLMTQAVFTMRNNAKQNLHVALPDGSDVWSCFVAGEAVQVTIKEGKLLLPLIQTGEEEPSFDVELTYVTPTDPLADKREVELAGPVVDLPMHNIRWEMYVPRGYTYGNFGGTVTWRDDIESQYREFGLSEYTSFLAKKMAGQKQKAAELVTKARRMAKKGDVVSARRQYRRAKQIDSDNTFIEQELGQLEKAEAYANVAQHSQQGQSYGQIFADNLSSETGASGEDVKREGARERLETSERNKAIERMQSIRIPEVDFRQANIHDVVNFLKEASVEFDASQGERRGVNMILNLQSYGEQVQNAPADPFAAVQAPDQASEVPLITFSARQIALWDVVKIVADVANLKVRVTDGGVVMFVRHDAPDSALIHRMYDVSNSLVQRLQDIAPDLTDGGFISLGGGGMDDDEADWKQLFTGLGVSWPRGSSIKYVASLGKLVVKNSPGNLDTFEETLSMLGGSSTQVTGTAWDEDDGWATQSPAGVTDRQVEVAEEQAKKIRRNQEVTRSRVTPLRVNLPVRGFRYLFEQVVWVPGDDRVAVSMKARPVGRGNALRYAGVLVAIFLGMACLVFGWLRRKAVAVLVSTAWLALVYVYVVFL